MARKKPGAQKPPAPAIVIDPKLEAQVAALLPQAPEPTPPRPRTWSAQETREQLSAVEGLLVQGARMGEIHRVLRRQWPASMKRARILVDRVKRQWADFAKDDDRVANREAAIRRLHAMRRTAEGLRDPNDKTGTRWLVKPDHAAVLGYERIIADLEGTKKPIEVNVDGRFTAAMLEVVANLTGDQASEMLETALEQKRLSDLARRELPALVMEPVAGSSSGHSAE